MIRRRVERLAHMDAAEIGWRLKSRGRALMDRVTTSLAAPSWKREHLAAALAPLPGLSGARAALAGRDWDTAHLELSRHFAAAPQRFVVGPAARQPLLASVLDAFPQSATHAAALANRILAGDYNLLGYERLRFDPSTAGVTDQSTSTAPGPAAGRSGPLVDWHFDPVHKRRVRRTAWSAVRYLDPSCGDHKIIWELNRHQHWLTLGRAFWLTGHGKYRDRFVAELLDWIEANPPLVGINWASMLELALRSLSWLWALSLFVREPRLAGAPEDGRDAAPWIVDLMVALDRQLTHVERHLSRYFSPNTHLLGEALALYVCGTALPELAAGPRRAETGRRILLAEIGKQIGADGGHLERSTHYHRYTFDFYLLALIVARINRDPAAAGFERAVSRLAFAARLLADDRGRVPHIGDDDGGMLVPMRGRHPDDLRDSLAVAAALLERPELSVGRVPEEAHWLLSHPALAGASGTVLAGGARHARMTSGALEETGYYVSRTASSDHLVIDGGPHGYQNAGHAHADALALTFSVRGRPLLIDPGTATYTSDRVLRDRFRSTASHNTVTIDGLPSSESSGPFHWRRMANSRVHRWRTMEGFDYFDGAHDGYHPLSHRRSVLALHGDLLIVADTIDGPGAHTVATHWHLDPRWLAHVRGRRATLRRRGQSVRLIVPQGSIEAFTGDKETGLGWHSPVYGRVEPTTTLRVVRAGELPFCMLTVFNLQSENPVLDVTPLPLDEGGFGLALAYRIERVASNDYVFIAGPGGGEEEGPGGRGPRSMGPGGRGPRSMERSGSLHRIGELETDARMLFYRATGERSVSRLAFVDGSLVRTIGFHGLRLEMPGEVPHYFADFAATHRNRARPPLRSHNGARWQCAASPAS